MLANFLFNDILKIVNQIDLHHATSFLKTIEYKNALFDNNFIFDWLWRTEN